MEDDVFTPEKFAHTLNTLGIWQSMVEQMLVQEIHTSPDCIYHEHLAQKLMDVHVSLMAMNSVYAHLYETYKETQTNG